MAPIDDAPRVEPRSPAEWRRWLQDHHASASGVWLVSFTKASGRERLTYDQQVEEALCFGWIDGTTRPVEDGRRAIYFAPRRRGSTWARTNKDRVQRLIADHRMAPAGMAAVDRAKADGSWTVLDAAESLTVPDDLAVAMAEHPNLGRRYQDLPDSGKKQLLGWVLVARRPQTRARRIAELVRRGEAGATLLP